MNLLDEIQMGSGSFCLVDIGTTGLSPAYEEITEIAAIRVDRNFKVLEEISCLIKAVSQMTRLDMSEGDGLNRPSQTNRAWNTNQFENRSRDGGRRRRSVFFEEGTVV